MSKRRPTRKKQARKKRSTAPSFGGPQARCADLDEARIAVLPVPYDRTSTWKKGARRGPRAIIDASANMELFDIETSSEVFRLGIHTLPAITYSGSPATLADRVESAVSKLYATERFPVVLGGEHSVSIGAFRAAAKKYDDLSILQLDAHGDTRQSYDGSGYNHACVMARGRELCPITQVGIRSLDAEELPFLDPERVFYSHDIAGKPDREWMDRVVDQQNQNVYVTIDLDVFDPSIVPATGTPEPGGLNWSEVNALLSKLVESRNVIGFDVVELLPTPGHWSSDFLAAKLIYRFLSIMFAEHG